MQPFWPRLVSETSARVCRAQQFVEACRDCKNSSSEHTRSRAFTQPDRNAQPVPVQARTSVRMQLQRECPAAIIRHPHQCRCCHPCEPTSCGAMPWQLQQFHAASSRGLQALRKKTKRTRRKNLSSASCLSASIAAEQNGLVRDAKCARAPLPLMSYQLCLQHSTLQSASPSAAATQERAALSSATSRR